MSSSHNEDKENHAPAENKNENRRDSFGKGILKNLRKDVGNHTIDVMQLALRDHQQSTASKKNLGKKSYRRRVSFAPEVTLHKIEFVPQNSNIEQRQPKRRETIAFAPSSSQISSDDMSLASSSQDPTLQFNSQNESIYPSSDVEMEDDSHVYSSPNRANRGPDFEIYSDEDSMNVTQGFSYADDDNNTMELTKPLGNIQQLSLDTPLNQIPFPGPIQQPSEEGETEREAGSSGSRLFGSITSIFDNDLADQTNEMEMEMDLTQTYSNKAGISDENLQSQDATSSSTTTAKELSVTDALTKQNTGYNRELQKDFDDYSNITATQPMEIDETQYSIADQTEVSMDVTRLASDRSSLSQAGEVYQSPRPSTTKKATSTTPLRPSKSHTSETGSPISSKRKNDLSDSATLNLRERINLLTPRKRRKSTGERKSMSATQEPIPTASKANNFSDSLILSKDEARSSFTPLRASKNTGRTSLITHQSSISTVEKSALAPSQESHIEEADEIEEYKPVPLKQFLADLAIEFFDNLDINDDFTVLLSQVETNTHLKKTDYLKAKMTKIPWLELYSFSCLELRKNMSELKKLFDDLNDEFTEENPPLVREYYQSISLPEQKKLSDHLLFMKTLSDKEAEVSWLTWSYQLLDELDNRLIINLESMEEDSKKIDGKLKEFTAFENELDAKLSELSGKIDELSKQNEIFEASQNEDVMKTRGELYEVLKDLDSQELTTDALRTKNEELSNNASHYKEIKEAVEQKRHAVKINGMDLNTRVNISTKLFSAIQSLSGVKLLSLKGTVLGVSFAKNAITASLDLSKLDNKDTRTFKVSEKLPLLTRTYIENFITKSAAMNLVDQFKRITHIVNSLNWLDNELYYLGLVSPLKVQMGDVLTITVKDINRSEGYKTQIKIELSEEALFTNLQPTNVSVQVMYGTISEKDTILGNWKAKSHANSWIQKI